MSALGHKQTCGIAMFDGCFAPESRHCADYGFKGTAESDWGFGSIAAAIRSPIVSLAAMRGSALRWAQRCVVCGWLCPSKPPIIGRDMPEDC